MKLQILLISTLAVSSLLAQETPADPFREPRTTAAAPKYEPLNISICYEAFSVPLAMAAKLQRQQLADSDLYKQLVTAVEKQTARQESLAVVRAKSGQKATTESVTEQIHPNEYNPPGVPVTVGVAISPPGVKDEPAPVPDAAKLKVAPDLSSLRGLQTPASPASFTTRNLGTTLEVEPMTGEDGQIVDVRIVPEMVTQTGRESWGNGTGTMEMPVIETQRINMAYTAHINQPFLIGTISRPPVSKVDPDSANRVWFAFVTATLAKP